MPAQARRSQQRKPTEPTGPSHADPACYPPAIKYLLGLYPELAGSEVLAGGMTTYGLSRGFLYSQLRQAGNGHRFSEMIACQRGPGLRTDVSFFKSQPKLADQFVDKKQMRKYIATARRHGGNPGRNDVYEPALARFPGDPEAFVPPTGGRGYIKRLCENRGWACEGTVNVPYQEPLFDPADADVPLAEDLVRQHVEEEIKRTPSLARNKKKLREKIVAKHGPSK